MRIIQLLDRDVEEELELVRERDDLYEVCREPESNVLLAYFFTNADIEVGHPPAELVEKWTNRTFQRRVVLERVDGAHFRLYLAIPIERLLGERWRWPDLDG